MSEEQSGFTILSRGIHRLLEFASRRSLIILMVALALDAIFNTLYDMCFATAYPIGDWLVNYSDGFVRRGLAGEFILLAARAVHVPPAWMAAVVEIAIYVAFLCGVYKLAAPLRRTVLWYAMMFSPAALAFIILTAMTGLRKDLLVMAALVATILLLRRGVSAVLLSLSITVLFAVMVLSHDALYCCFPYFFAAVALSAKDLKYAAKVMTLPFIVAALLIDAVLHHQGNETTAIAVCKSVGGKWLGTDDFRNLCGGAIGHLGWTLARTRQEELANLHYWPLYAMLAVLSFAPFIATLVVLYRRDRLHFEVKVISWIAVLCAVASLPLFYLSIDWGRWIQMQVVCLLLVILMAARRAQGFQPSANAKPVGAGKPWRAPLLVAVFLYCTCWTLPLLGMQNLRFGYVELPLYYHREFKLMRQFHGWQKIDRGW